jgi:hypothetical protein
MLSALYGKPYIKAAKDTWTMFTDRGTLRRFFVSTLRTPNILGIDALVNDSLVGISESPVGDADVF